MMLRRRSNASRAKLLGSAVGVVALLLVGFGDDLQAEPSVRAEQGGVAFGGNVRDSIITIGIPAAELGPLIADIMRDERAQHQAELAALSQELAVTDEAVITFLKILGRDPTIPDDQLVTTLVEIAERHRSQLARLQVLDAENPEIAATIREARAAIEDGRYDEAEVLLAQAEVSELAAIRMAEDLARQAQAAADQRRLNAANLRVERGELELTRLDYLAAAETFRRAAELLPDAAQDERGDYLNRSAYALYLQGIRRVDRLALPRAVVAYGKALEVFNRDALPRQWATTQNNLGLALQAQGSRIGGADGRRLLTEAVAAYDQALSVFQPAKMTYHAGITTQNKAMAEKLLLQMH